MSGKLKKSFHVCDAKVEKPLKLSEDEKHKNIDFKLVNLID